MTTRRLTLPLVPSPGQEITQEQMIAWMRSLDTFMRQVQVPGEGRHTTLVLTNLQSDDYTLEIGALFEHDGVIKIARANVPHVRGVSGSAAVGSVTVTTA